MLTPIASAFLFPLLGHFALVAILYVWLSVLRMQAVARNEAKIDDFARANSDPRAAARVQRNLSNQFEAPVFVYFAASVLLALGAITWFDVLAVWVFLIGRIIHTLVQTLTDNVKLRGQVFVINFLGVLALMGHVGLLVFKGIAS
jgi:hypothetical protein